MTPDDSDARDASIDDRARDLEEQLNDEERFSLVISVLGTAAGLVPRDPRIPESVENMGAGCTRGVPRLGVVAMLGACRSNGS